MTLDQARKISEFLEKENSEREISICSVATEVEWCLVSSFNGNPQSAMFTEQHVINLFETNYKEGGV